MNLAEILSRPVIALSVVAQAAACSTAAPVQRPADGPTISVRHPATQSILFTNRQAEILIKAPHVVPGQHVLEVFAIPDGPTSSVSIAALELAADPRTDEFLVLWNPRAAPPGDYTVNAVLRRGDQAVATDSIDVTLAVPPRVELLLGAMEASGQGIAATLTVRSSVPQGVSIVDHRWWVGDMDEPLIHQGPTLTRIFTPGTRTMVAISVVDSRGGTSLLVAPVDMPKTLPPTRVPDDSLTVPPAQSCGCKSMVVRATRGQSASHYCANPAMGAKLASSGCTKLPVNAPPGTPGPLLCLPGLRGYRCPVGPVVPNFAATPKVTSFSSSFEVAATLVEGSTPEICNEGQYARADTTFEGAKLLQTPPSTEPSGQTLPAGTSSGGTPLNINLVPAGKDQPVPGNPQGLWGPDDYTAPRTLKVHEPQIIRWWDAPGAHGLSRQPSSAFLGHEFVSFVSGTTGTCWCKFRVTHALRNGAAVGPGAVMQDGLNCTVQ